MKPLAAVEYQANSGGSKTLIWIAIVIPLGIFYAVVYGPEAAFVYQFSGIFASGLTPIIAVALLKYGNGSYVPLYWYVVFSAIVSALSALWIGKHKTKSEETAGSGVMPKCAK